MKVSLCYYLILCRNSDQQTNIVFNFINSFSSSETCNSHEFNTVVCVFCHLVEIKNDQPIIFFSIWLCYTVHRLVASTVCGFTVTHSNAYHLMITLLLKLSLNYTQSILTLDHKNILIFMCSFIQ